MWLCTSPCSGEHLKQVQAVQDLKSRYNWDGWIGVLMQQRKSNCFITKTFHNYTEKKNNYFFLLISTIKFVPVIHSSLSLVSRRESAMFNIPQQQPVTLQALLSDFFWLFRGNVWHFHPPPYCLQILLSSSHTCLAYCWIFWPCYYHKLRFNHVHVVSYFYFCVWSLKSQYYITFLA